MSNSRMNFMLDLQRVEKEDYQLREGEKHEDYITLMLQHIGDADPELRDKLIYPTFCEWIQQENRLTETELSHLLSVLTDDKHLFYHIGNEEDHTVFTRTFSVLPIVNIMWHHRHHSFLNHTQFQHLKHSLLRYYREERDLRGYVYEGGWAHSAAHGADALEELVQCPESDTALQYEVLDVVLGMLHNGKHIFNEEEDERIVSILDTMMNKGLLQHQDISEWINGLTQCMELPKSRNQDIARVNSKNLLRSLYFRRGEGGYGHDFTKVLLRAEAKLNVF